jgi:hypothetical protein
MKPECRNNSDHLFVLPITTELNDETVAELSRRIISLPPNLKLTPIQRRFIEIMVPLLFDARLFLCTVTLDQIAELYAGYTGASDINSQGVGWVMDGLFADSDSVVSGLYQVIRCNDGYRFQFNDEVLPEILHSIP